MPSARSVQTAGTGQVLCLCCGYHADHSIPVPPSAGRWTDRDGAGNRAIDLRAQRPVPDDGSNSDSAATGVTVCDAIDLLPMFIVPQEFFANLPNFPVSPPPTTLKPALPPKSPSLLMPPPPPPPPRQLKSKVLTQRNRPYVKLLPSYYNRGRNRQNWSDAPVAVAAAPPPPSPPPSSSQPKFKVPAQRDGPYGQILPASRDRGRSTCQNRSTPPVVTASPGPVDCDQVSSDDVTPDPVAPENITLDLITPHDIVSVPVAPGAEACSSRGGLDPKLLVVAKVAYEKIMVKNVENPPPVQVPVQETSTTMTVTITTTISGF